MRVFLPTVLSEWENVASVLYAGHTIFILMPRGENLILKPQWVYSVTHALRRLWAEEMKSTVSTLRSSTCNSETTAHIHNKIQHMLRSHYEEELVPCQRWDTARLSHSRCGYAKEPANRQQPLGCRRMHHNVAQQHILSTDTKFCSPPACPRTAFSRQIRISASRECTEQITASEFSIVCNTYKRANI